MRTLACVVAVLVVSIIHAPSAVYAQAQWMISEIGSVGGNRVRIVVQPNIPGCPSKGSDGGVLRVTPCPVSKSCGGGTYEQSFSEMWWYGPPPVVQVFRDTLTLESDVIYTFEGTWNAQGCWDPPTCSSPCHTSGAFDPRVYVHLGAGIGVFADLSATCSNVIAPAFTPGTMYILATLGGASGAGLTGAEFRVVGLPTDWYVSAIANPAASAVLGSPIGDGANIAFPTCQSGTNGVVLLYSISYYAISTVSNRQLTVQVKIPPSDPTFYCPAVFLCDAPIFTEVCVGGVSGIINGTPNPCLVAVKRETWSGVKAMYR